MIDVNELVKGDIVQDNKVGRYGEFLKVGQIGDLSKEYEVEVPPRQKKEYGVAIEMGDIIMISRLDTFENKWTVIELADIPLPSVI